MELAGGYAPRWSPDGAWIAAGNQQLVSPDGTTTQRLPRLCWRRAWSPDGRQLACGSGSDALSVIDIATGEVHQVADGQHVEPAWSADGATLVFADYDPTSQARRIEAIDVDGTNRRVLSTAPTYGFATRPGPSLRLAGATRVETAVAVSRHTWTAATHAVLARSDLFPDALAAAPLATAVDGPVLLTGRDRLHPAVKAELDRLAGCRRRHADGRHHRPV